MGFAQTWGKYTVMRLTGAADRSAHYRLCRVREGRKQLLTLESSMPTQLHPLCGAPRVVTISRERQSAPTACRRNAFSGVGRRIAQPGHETMEF
jgi:hypothetical protein